MSKPSPEALQAAEELYKLSCRTLAVAYSVFKRNDLGVYNSLADVSLYDYLHGAIDFDQLCEDVAEQMEDIKKG